MLLIKISTIKIILEDISCIIFVLESLDFFAALGFCKTTDSR
jgi:hypothetical protein